ncbi:MAG TPA: hypothetical protein VHL59_01195 [Thermoanaerobaculia bacterium]|nr:hypothetical protein [Thermoanaerobaculia bacterium]
MSAKISCGRPTIAFSPETTTATAVRPTVAAKTSTPRAERHQHDGRQQHGDVEQRECLRGAPYEAGRGDEGDDDRQERAARDTPAGERDGDGDQ